MQRIEFQVDPNQYRHWRVVYNGDIAELYMDVDEQSGLFEGYQLKLNSYDLGVDIELADVVQRMRFEHPKVKVIVLQSGKDGIFCAGANIRMLAGASHAHKVNFCKFTNETRNTFEAAGDDSGQQYICAVKGSCAGGGYELALACNYIILTDDRASSVSLPEVPLLAVLPGTGGLTRLVDKRKVRRDLSDVFCSTEEGVRGVRAQDWNLVDEVVANSSFTEAVQQRAQQFVADSSKQQVHQDIRLHPLQRTISDNGDINYSLVHIAIDRQQHKATITLSGPEHAAPESINELVEQGCDSYLLRLARELDDAVLQLRFNETEIGLLVFCTQGDGELLAAHEQMLLHHTDHWLANEILQYWKRLLKRIDMTSRSMIALVEHGSCFTGVLAELLWAVDRCYMMEGDFEGDNRPNASIRLGESNFGLYPMGNGLTRLDTRFIGQPEHVEHLHTHVAEQLEATTANELGLITYMFDDIDWQDEIRIFIEERVSFSPDAMTGMEANLRFAGPETMETRIFGRLTAWQNWIFQRPNAVGTNGALQSYGTGHRGNYDRQRV